MKGSRLWLILSILLCSIIFLMTATPLGRFVTSEKLLLILVQQQATAFAMNYYVRRAAHVLLFGLLAVAIQRTINKSRFSYIIAWAMTTMYGMFDEWHQTLAQARSSRLGDVILDSVGAMTFLIILWLILRIGNADKKEKHYKN